MAKLINDFKIEVTISGCTAPIKTALDFIGIKDLIYKFQIRERR